ncbi:MAG: helix-turn-helix domain-containing protein [Chryseolinea sp.]
MKINLSFEEMIEQTVIEGIKKAVEQIKNDQIQPYLTAADVSKILKIDVATIHRMCRSGELKHSKFGKSTRIDRADFIEYCKVNRIE